MESGILVCLARCRDAIKPSPITDVRMESFVRWAMLHFMEGAASVSTTSLWAERTSDGDSHNRAALVLRQSRIPALRNLRVEESSTGITILGRVTSYYLKQLAQEAVMPVLDHRELHNEILVVQVSE